MTSRLEDKIKSSLDNSTHDLDANTRQRLQHIRQQVLKQNNRNSWLSAYRHWAPATGLAMCGIIAAAIWIPQMLPSDNLGELEQTAMIELIEYPEDIDMLSDPSFYLWLDELEEEYV